MCGTAVSDSWRRERMWSVLIRNSVAPQSSPSRLFPTYSASVFSQYSCVQSIFILCQSHFCGMDDIVRTFDYDIHHSKDTTVMWVVYCYGNSPNFIHVKPIPWKQAQCPWLNYTNHWWCTKYKINLFAWFGFRMYRLPWSCPQIIYNHGRYFAFNRQPWSNQLP